MRKIFTKNVVCAFVLMLSVFALGSTASAQTTGKTLLVEDFPYQTGSLLTDNGWTAHSGAGTNPIATVSPGLSIPGYPSSGIGNAVAMTVSGEDVNRTYPVQTSGSVYAAFMVNISEASVDENGGYFFHLGADPLGTTFRGRVFIKKDASGNIAFGITKAATTGANFTPFSYALNTTYLVIVKYTIIDGTGNDTVSISVSTTTPATEPAPAVSAPDNDGSDVNPGTVALRQGSTATSPTLKLDGIRIGTSFASVTGTPAVNDANVDFNGDGRSDYVVTRGLAAGNTNNPIRWFINENGTGKIYGYDFGLTTDMRVPADYDGDGKDDVAVWRTNGSNGATFYILQSSDLTVRVVNFGLLGDDPKVVGDYDGDGKDDIAVYRKNGNGQNFFYYIASSNNPNNAVNFVPWGSGVNVRPNVGDYDGDGKNDFCVFNQAGQFILLRSSDLGVEYIKWGIGSDALVPGDSNNDGRDDFIVVRNENGGRNWYILQRGQSAQNGIGPIRFGLPTDILTPGDYDGDGKQDIAVWRPSQGVFYVMNSLNGSLTVTQWGTSGDNPEATWAVHEGSTN